MVKKIQNRPSAGDAGLLASALTSLTEGVVIARLTGGRVGSLKILFVNPAFCAMMGYSGSELVGKKLETLAKDRREATRLLRWLSAGKRSAAFVGEGHLQGKGGLTRYLAWSASAVRPSAGRGVLGVITYRDVTEKRRLDEAMIHAQRLDAVGHLAGGVAHDFNNLLSVINGYCEIVASRLTYDKKSLRQIGEIHAAGRRGAELTQQLLAFGRRQPTNAQVVNFNDIVRDNVEILGRLIGDGGRLDVALAPNLGNVRADPAQFMQALLNLVLNARDSLKKHGRIVISTTNREIGRAKLRRVTDVPPGQYVSISVSDNGTGIDRDAKRHLFEPFFTTKPKGNGLGLALVYGVVQQCGGYVSASSELSVGTTVEILLPEVHLPVVESARTRVIKPLPVTRGRETVLLLEEDDVVRKMVAGILTADGYRVIETRLPGLGLTKARKAVKPVELLIANLTHPDVERLARALYEDNPSLRILNLSPQAWTPDWLPPSQVFRLPKPFALSELLRAARRIQDR